MWMAAGKFDFFCGVVGVIMKGGKNPFRAVMPLTPEQLKRNTEEAFREMEIFFRQQATRQGK